MKTITKEYQVYPYEELSKEAQERALRDWLRTDDYPFLEDDLREYIHEQLTKRGYTHTEITPMYDLSHSQGSGLMFEGSITDKNGNTYTIKHRGHYYHERSGDISGVDKEGNDIEIEDFEENVYIPICTAVRDRGYDVIAYLESAENFQEVCGENDYNFLADGKMVNY